MRKPGDNQISTENWWNRARRFRICGTLEPFIRGEKSTFSCQEDGCEDIGTVQVGNKAFCTLHGEYAKYDEKLRKENAKRLGIKLTVKI